MDTVLNNILTTLRYAYTAGDGQLVLASGYGATIAARLAAESQPSISVSHPIRLTVITSNTLYIVFQATGLAGDVVTGSVVEGVDQNFASGTLVSGRWTSGLARQLEAAGGSGTVTTVSVASANGLAGTVANPTTTPALTLSTTITGILKGNGTAISAASAGSDYLTPSGNGSALTGLAGSQISGNISGNAANVTGTVAIANGGTGQTTAAAGFDALTPTQTANSGKFLTTNGTTASWATVTSGGSPGGTTGNLQYNDGTTTFAGAAWSTVAASGNLLTITAPNTTDVPLKIKLSSGTPTGNAAEIRSNADVLLAYFDAKGNATFVKNGGSPAMIDGTTIGSGFAGIWFGAAATTTPTSNNLAFLGNGVNTSALNVPTGGILQLRVGGVSSLILSDTQEAGVPRVVIGYLPGSSSGDTTATASIIPANANYKGLMIRGNGSQVAAPLELQDPTTARTLSYTPAGIMKTAAANEATGSGSAALSTNCPAVTATGPYTWIKFITSDGSVVYIPAWK